MKKRLFFFSFISLFLLTSCVFQKNQSNQISIVIPGDRKGSVEKLARSVNVSDIGIYILEVNSMGGNPIFENGNDLFYSQTINVLSEAQKINLSNVNDGTYELTLIVKVDSTMEVTRVTESVTVRNGNDCNVTFRVKLSDVDSLEYSEGLGSRNNPIDDYAVLKQKVESILITNYSTVLYVAPGLFIDVEESFGEEGRISIYPEGITVKGNVTIKGVDKNNPSVLQYKTEAYKSLFTISKNGTLILENIVIDGDTEMVDDVAKLPNLGPYITIEAYGQLFAKNVEFRNINTNVGVHEGSVIYTRTYGSFNLENVKVLNSSTASKALIYMDGEDAGTSPKKYCYVNGLAFENCKVDEAQTVTSGYVYVGNGRLCLEGALKIPRIYVNYKSGSSTDQFGYVLRNGPVTLADETTKVGIYYVKEYTNIMVEDNYNIFTNYDGTVWDKNPESDVTELFTINNYEKNSTGTRVLHPDGTIANPISSFADLNAAVSQVSKNESKTLVVDNITSTTLETISVNEGKNITIQGNGNTLSGIRFYLADNSKLTVKNIILSKDVDDEANCLILVSNGSTFTAIDTEFDNSSSNYVIKIGENNPSSANFIALDLRNVKISNCINNSSSSDALIYACGYNSNVSTLKIDGLQVIECNCASAIELNGGNTLCLQGELQIPSIKLALNKEVVLYTGQYNTAYLQRTGTIELAETTERIQLIYNGEIPDNWNIFSDSYSSPNKNGDLVRTDDVDKYFYCSSMNVQKDGLLSE